MYNFYKHSEIPTRLRNIVKEQEGVDRITELDIGYINTVLNELEENEKVLEALKQYEVISRQPDSQITIKKFTELDDAYVELDRLTNYGEGSDVVIVMRQAGRFVRGYQNRQWIYPTNQYDY